MQLGIHIVNFTLPAGPAALGPTLGAVAAAAEAAGLSHISMMDHFFQLEMLGGGELDMLEGYTALGFLAAKTHRIRLGLLVTGVTYRHPGILAKIVTTLDILSGGRADLGIGAAWYEREHAGLGVPYPALAERFERLEETLQICLQMWSTNDGPYRGRHYTLEETRNVPQTLQAPHPPIMIGGMGEKKTLRLVAQYADACNLFPEQGSAGIKRKLDILRDHCRDCRRDYADIEKTMLHMAALPRPAEHAAFIESMREYHALGIQRVMVMPGVEDPARDVADLAPVAAALAAF